MTRPTRGAASTSSHSSPPPDTPGSGQTLTGLTQEQNFRLFEHKKRVAEMEEEKARLNNERARMGNGKVKLALDKARFELEKARFGLEKAWFEIEKARSGLDSQPASTVGNRSLDNEDEIPSEIKPIMLRFPGLPQEQVVKIFSNNFKPINLYRLYRGLGLRHKEEGKGTRVVDGVLKMKEIGIIYEDYGTSFYDVWSGAFDVYRDIMFSLFGKTRPGLFSALGRFRTKIHELSRVYKWQGAVLPLALDAHADVLATQPTEAVSWVIRQELQEFYCKPFTVLRTRRSDKNDFHRRSRSHTRQNTSSHKSTVVCENFNKGNCSSQSCKRTHKCKKCGEAGHGRVVCKKQ